MKIRLQWSAMSACQFVVWLSDKLKRQCETMISHPDIIVDIQSERYDLLISDFIDNCGQIVSDYVNIPTMLNELRMTLNTSQLSRDVPVPVVRVFPVASGKNIKWISRLTSESRTCIRYLHKYSIICVL